MSQSEGPLAGIQRRAAESPDARYRAFDSYPWAKDTAFVEQLLATLHHAQSNKLSLSEAALQNRIQRFEQQTQIKVDGDAYKEWLAQNNQQPPRIVHEQSLAMEAISVPNPDDRVFAHLLVELGDPLGHLALQQITPAPTDVPVPSWQSAAPTGELYVNKDLASANPDKEPYPKKFEEIVEFLKSGKPIEGIRQIPDTVIEDPSISTHGRLKAPLKPWEIGRTASTDASQPNPESKEEGT
ncbi:hypothetical protein M426DRAFT_152571 [Hypoxylon sp. CI-4A]|nr:hypothetical protein M426DRAFT_152571 [Hypoxylon sp. CI-4A]